MWRKAWFENMEKYVITIGRGYGSGGRTIGKMLAEELGIHYYDKEILKLTSKVTGINEKLIKQADEQLKSGNIVKISNNVYRGEQYGGEDDLVSNTNLFNYQAKVLNELADRESFVIIGRCANYVLRDRKRVVRIFVYASMENCIKKVSNVSSLDEGDIENFIKTTDLNRARYYKFNTGRDWSDARDYDLCFSTDNITYEQAVVLIKNYLKLKGIIR